MWKKIFFAICLCFSSVQAVALDFPTLTGQVVDEADILTSQTEQVILSSMKPNQQFVVVTLKSLRGLQIEEYGVALGRHWGIGNKEKSDGILLIVAPTNGKQELKLDMVWKV